MSILKYDKFIESNLNLQELGKTKDGILRGDVLVNKLINNDVIVTDTNKSVQISKMKSDNEWVDIEDGVKNITNDEGKYDIDKSKDYFTRSNRYRTIFKSYNGEELKLNQIKKTVDFGSSGSGRLTRNFESIQCVFLAIKQSSPNDKITPDNIVDLYDNYIESTRNGQNILYIPNDIQVNKELLTDFINDKDWVSTFCDVSNELWDRSIHIDKNNLYYIYQIGYTGKSPVKEIQNKFKKFSIDGGFNDINFAKWCPADVYLISSDVIDIIYDDIRGVKDINELINLCDAYFDNGKMIPISLKKTSRKSRPLIIINKEVNKELPTFKIRSFIIGDDKQGIGSKIFVKSIWKYRTKKMPTHKDRILNLDSSDTNKYQNIDGEVIGSTSRHGKISLKSMIRIIKSVEVPFKIDILDSIDLRSMETSELEEIVTNLVDILKYNKNIKYQPSNRGSILNGNKGRLISKIQSLQIVYYISELYKYNKSQADSIITKIMRYALSIQTDKFDTPRYLRIL